MGGTAAGGRKAAATNKKRYGDTFYAVQGKKGGELSTGHVGFALNPELAREAGRKGGKASRKSEPGTETVQCPFCPVRLKNNLSLSGHKWRTHQAERREARR